MAELGERELVDAAKRGDRQALGQLLLATFDDVAHYIEPRIPAALRRHVSAEDIVQQTFARAFVEFSSFEYRGGGSLNAWLRTIAEHRLLDVMRAQSRQKRGGDRFQVEAKGGAATHSVGDLMNLLAADDGTPSHVLRHQEADQAMRTAIESLPGDYRQVIQLRFMEGKSIQETAEIMQRSEASVRALADRAKKQLREAIGRFSAYLSSRGRT